MADFVTNIPEMERISSRIEDICKQLVDANTKIVAALEKIGGSFTQSSVLPIIEGYIKHHNDVCKKTEEVLMNTKKHLDTKISNYSAEADAISKKLNEAAAKFSASRMNRINISGGGN